MQFIGTILFFKIKVLHKGIKGLIFQTVSSMLAAQETCELAFTLTLFVVISYDYKIETSTILT